MNQLQVDTAPARETSALTGNGTSPLLARPAGDSQALVPNRVDSKHLILADLFEQDGFRSAHRGALGEAAFSRRGAGLRQWRPPSVLKDAARGSEVALNSISYRR